ncbi:MAG: hypothetical protein R6U44_06505 [Archaeoglobaceae archaeon]
MNEEGFCVTKNYRSKNNKMKIVRISLIAALVLVISSLGVNTVQAQAQQQKNVSETIIIVKETVPSKTEEIHTGVIQLEDMNIEPKNIEPGQTFELSFDLENHGRRLAEDLVISMETQESTSYVKETSTTSSQLPTETQSTSNIYQTSQPDIFQKTNHTQTQTSPTQSQTQQTNTGIMPLNQGTKQFIMYLRPYESEEITYTLRAPSGIDSGVHIIDFSLKYEYNDRQLSSDLQVGILVEGEEDLGVVDTSYLEINPGDEDVEVNTVIQNLGTREARSIVVEPVIEYPFNTKTDQGKQLGSLDQDEKGSLSLDLDIDEDITSGNYLIPLNISYTIDNQRVTAQRNISVKITGEPDIEIIKTQYTPETPSAGEKVTMIVTVKNTGEKEIESLSIQGIEKVNQPVTYTRDKDFVGALDPGETAQGALELKFGGDAISKIYQLKTMMSGVEDEDVYTFTEYPEIKIGEKENKSIIERIMDLLPIFP